MAKRLDVKQLRRDHGMSQADLARHIWGDDLDSKTLELRRRTITRWENHGSQPSTLHAKHLKELANSKQKPDNSGGTQSDSPHDEPRPKRRAIGGMLPSMGDA